MCYNSFIRKTYYLIRLAYERGGETMGADFLSLLGNYVFPVVACCAMAYFVKYMYDQTNKRIDDLNAQHKDEVDNLSTVISNNTVAIEKMNTLIERLEKQ